VSVPEPDADLIRRFRDGDSSAFTNLVERHSSKVYGVCLRILGNPEDAHDAAQDTFLTVFHRLDGFRGEAAFTTWLHRIAVNACYDELRRRKRRPILHVAPEEPDGPPREPGEPTADPAEAVANSLDAAAALARVPEDFRIALVLADIQDLAYEDIARVLDVPVGTVKSRVHRGRVALALVMGLGDSPGVAEPSRGVRASEDEP
jgi:RNA polymerase sigma-70 factor (ECF subfamily)